MIRLINKVVRSSKQKYSQVSSFNKYLTTNISIENSKDTFGVGSKFAKLDAVKKPKSTKNSSLISEEDQFGTITNEFKSITFKSSITSAFPTSKEILDEDEDEKKFDKVVNHIRLSNDEYKPHTSVYYSKRMKEFAKEGKVNFTKFYFIY